MTSENRQDPRGGGGQLPGMVSRLEFWQIFWSGVRGTGTTPAVVLFAGALGFGALARDVGFSVGQAAFQMVMLFALPAQVLLVDQIARGGDLFTAAFAVWLAGVRLLPMTITLTPFLGVERRRLVMLLLAVHPIAVTVWLEGMRRLPKLDERQRFPHFIGLGWALIVATTAGTVAGYYVAGQVPFWVTAALLFLTPMYFGISLLGAGRTIDDRLAMVFGFLLCPLLFAFLPGVDLLGAGLIGGSLAYLIGRRFR